ncbi:MAG: RNA polymerase sigma-70 factor [Dysgonamonadaceae bacterium]|jgi:RNA polymerase sigma-70 factor (ECF subfamily)|nr:RNA polymerase sigma-70 factor [Dysgonamonadaceae bacterium]
MSYRSEKNDLLKLRNGSPEVFEKLFHQYGGRLYNFILKRSSGNTYLTEEIVQNTFIRIWETRACLDPDKSFLSYLCTIAKNMLINEYEHQMVEYVYKDYILKYCSEIDNVTEKEIDKNLLEEYVDCLIEKLPPGRKQVFILSRKKMLSNKEISEQLQISESTVQSQLSKAVSFMKKHLSVYYDLKMIMLLTYTFIC